MRRIVWLLVQIFVVAWMVSGAVSAQQPQAGAVSAQQQQPEGPPPLSPEQLEQLVAPIALYPDPLLAQIFMGSTYPLEIVEAARWSKQNPKVTGDALEDAMQKQSWDPSVKSLTAFPPVLAMMDEKLDWTQKLGDAFLAQQKDVMDAVQRLRARAQASGNLESNKEQKVTVQQVENTQAAGSEATGGQATGGQATGGQAAGGSQTTVIQIEPANPQVVYVPTYNPTVVYGAWPYPAAPPYAYYPPGYVATSLLSFGAGMAVGAALWGNCNWGGGNVNYNINNYNNFNKTNISNSNWQHNSSHRKGVEYRDNASREKYGRGSGQNAQSRDAFRGRAEQGRQSLGQESGRAGAGNRQGAGGQGGNRAQGGNRQGVGDQAGNRGQGGNRQGAGGQAGNRGQSGNRQGVGDQGGRAQQRPAGGGREAGSTRPSTQPRQEGMGGSRDPSAFKDVGRGNDVRQQADRGHSSRQSAQQYGGGRGGGGSGGGRGGGGGGGGGGRGGGGGGGRGGGGGGRGGGRR